LVNGEDVSGYRPIVMRHVVWFECVHPFVDNERSRNIELKLITSGNEFKVSIRCLFRCFPGHDSSPFVKNRVPLKILYKDCKQAYSNAFPRLVCMLILNHSNF
jgi:hypothetical protein